MAGLVPSRGNIAWSNSNSNVAFVCLPCICILDQAIAITGNISFSVTYGPSQRRFNVKYLRQAMVILPNAGDCHCFGTYGPNSLIFSSLNAQGSLSASGATKLYLTSDLRRL